MDSNIAALERALATCEKELGPDHPDTARSLNNLALLLHDRGELAAARGLFERALTIRERVLGPDHPHTAASRRALERGSDRKAATSLNNLGTLLHDQGDLRAARPHLE